MIIGNEIYVKWNKSNKKMFIEKGYTFTNYGDIFKVDLKDLNMNSRYKVDFICDYCGRKSFRSYHRLCIYDKHTCGSQECKKLIRKEVCLNKYGVENINQNPTIKQKGANTFKQRYGKESPIHKEFIDNRNNTNLKKSGNKSGISDYHSLQSKAVKTLFDNYKNAKCRKGTTKNVATSKQQIHICEMLDGILNYEFKDKIIDVVLDQYDYPIAIEYDGGGHQYWDDQYKDKQRDDLLIQHNWKVIHIINNRDTVFPNSNALKQIINLCSDLFSHCSLIYIDFVHHKIIHNKVINLTSDNQLE